MGIYSIKGISHRMKLLYLFSLVPYVSACGFTVHMLNSHRALSTPLASTPQSKTFMALLRGNLGSVFAGSPYPDYLYECGPNHDDGEYTHWAPFQAIAAKYIRETYPTPRNASGEQLVAFLAGVVSHYMADISWHGLAETTGGYGFIQTIGALDFNDTGYLISSAHTEADTGGEFVAAYENALPWDDPTQWVIPIPDLLEIYKRANRSDVTSGAIEECAAIFFAGAEAVRAAAALAEPFEAASSPTLDESFSGMLVGGSDDMAVMVGRMWGRFATWLEEGPPSPVPGHEYCNVQNPCAQPPPAHAKARSGLRARQDSLRVLGRAVRRAGLLEEARDAEGRLALRLAGHASPQLISSLLVGELRERLTARGGHGSTSGTWHRGLGQRHTGSGGGEGARNGSWTEEVPRDASPYRFYSALKHLLGMPVARDIAHRAGFTPPSHSHHQSGSEGGGDAAAPLLPQRPQTAAAPPPSSSPDFLGASTTTREDLGAALAVGDFNGDGLSDLVATAYGASPEGVYIDDAVGLSVLGNGSVGAVLPQAGGFYARYSGEAARTRRGSSVAVEPFLTQDRSSGASVYSRLGSSACAIDINLDGVDDLVRGTDLPPPFAAKALNAQGLPPPPTFPLSPSLTDPLPANSSLHALSSFTPCTQILGSPSAGWAWSSSPWNETPLFYYQGRVEVYLGVKGVGLPSPIAQPSLLILPVTNSSFLGQVLHCGTDVSGDGSPDLVIGSPFWQDPTLPSPAGVQRGRVDAFFASPHFAAATGTGTGSIRSSAPRAPPPLTLPITAANFSALGMDQYEWLGHALAALPNATAALSVSARELHALALAAGPGGALHPTCAHLAPTSSASAAGPAGSASSASLILAGAPGARRDYGSDLGFAAVGALRAYLVPHPGTPFWDLLACQRGAAGGTGAGAGAAPLFTILAPRSHRLGPMISTKLGAAVSVGYPLPGSPPMVALGAPCIDLCNSSGLIPGAPPDALPTSAGSVLLFPLTPALRGVVQWSDLAAAFSAPPFFTRALLGAALPDARFGWALQFRSDLGGGNASAAQAAGADDLVVAAPQYSKFFLASGAARAASGQRSASAAAAAAEAAPSPSPAPPGDSGRQAGAVFVFRGGEDSLPKGFLCAAEGAAAFWTEGIAEHGRLGGAWDVADWNNDGGLDFIISAPREGLAIDSASAPVEYGGALHVFKLPLY